MVSRFGEVDTPDLLTDLFWADPNTRNYNSSIHVLYYLYDWCEKGEDAADYTPSARRVSYTFSENAFNKVKVVIRCHKKYRYSCLYTTYLVYAINALHSSY